MTDAELTTTILRQIRDEIIATRTELKSEIAKTNERIDVTNDKLEITNERLTIVESVVRDCAEQVGTLTRYVRHAHGAAIDDLRDRVTRLEHKVG